MSSPLPPWARRCIAVVLLGSPACGGGELQWVGGDNGDDGGTTMSPAPVPPESDSTTSEGDTTGLPSLFLGHPDFGDGHRCDLWAQDCPSGTKCMLYASMGGSLDATGCFPIAPDPDAVGEPCTAEGRASGIDTCELGAMCWDVNPETNEGTCVAYCSGSHADPYCEAPNDICPSTRIPVCLPNCCPMEQDCPDGQACYPEDNEFFCSANAAPNAVYGDACEFLNVCPAGTFCADPSIGLDCQDGAQGCCLPFCTLGTDDCVPFNPGYECLPWYEPGTAPPGYELTGFCSAVEE